MSVAPPKCHELSEEGGDALEVQIQGDIQQPYTRKKIYRIYINCCPEHTENTTTSQDNTFSTENKQLYTLLTYPRYADSATT